MLFWFPGIWIIAFVTATVLTIKNRKDWFAEKRWWTVFSFILCTPIPIMVIVGSALRTYGTENGARSYMSMYNYKGGQRIKMESWRYDNGQTYVDKYFTADSLDELTRGEESFLKDSVWVYYDKEGEVIKKEKYRDGQLIKY